MNARMRATIGCFGRVGLAVAMIGAASCDERLQDLAGPSPSLTPTFSSIRAEILEKTDLAGRHACVSCHNAAGRDFQGQLNLATDAYNSIVNVRSLERPAMLLVSPGDPENSYLIHKIEGRSGILGARMPFSGPPFLTSGQIVIIRRWIELGARND